MASFNGDGHERHRMRRGNTGRHAHRDRPRVESLEERTLLSNGGLLDQPPQWVPTSTDLADWKRGPMANAGHDLVQIHQAYQRYITQGASGKFADFLARDSRFGHLAKNILIKDNFVGVTVRGYGNFTSLRTALRNLGMQVDATSAKHRMVEGLVPISQLPLIARMSGSNYGVVGIDPIYRPILNNQGDAPNQANQVLATAAARQQFRVDGRGVTVGVLSDSVNQFQGGLADSINSGDLPPMNRINVLQDEDPTLPGASLSDEGRAMMELIYDIAPGVNFAFHTAWNVGPAGFASGIRALAQQAGARVIVDDITLFQEPFFQDGLVAQAVTEVTTQNNVIYFSAAGNHGDQGFESPFRGFNTTVGNLGSGRFMDFDPGPGRLAQLPITVNAATTFSFQWDNPWFTSNGVQTDLDIFVLDTNGAIVASGTDDNRATGRPQELFTIPDPGAPTNYTLVIQVAAGPDPGRIRFQGFGFISGEPRTVISKQFGTAGGITYPTTFGHKAAAESIGVGAVPWYGAPPFLSPSPVRSEPFSSHGPVNILFDPQGNRLPQMQTRQKPDLSAPDGTSTSFFGGPPIDTTNPPPGTPSTPTNVNDPNFPNFFGTSAAAPNLAAVAALMVELVPTASTEDVRAAMIASARPLNNAATGEWNIQGGFGLVNAVSALNAIDEMRVTATTPGHSQTVNRTPSEILVTFSRPVDMRTVQASDLQFIRTPGDNIRVEVGTPRRVNETTVAFPISIQTDPVTDRANGRYVFRLSTGAVTSTDGKRLVRHDTTFRLQDTTAPRITRTTITPRFITIQFSEGMRAETITKASIMLIRTGGVGSFGRAENVQITADPRVVVAYDARTNRVGIDLRNLPQSALPTDRYALVVRDIVRDGAGNRLDGNFRGVFPSGDGRAGGDFVQDLGVRTLTAPEITFLQIHPQSDTGIPGDRNTRLQRPTLVGQVTAGFPGTVAGLRVLVQFSGLHGGSLDLRPGPGGRGHLGAFDFETTTNANGEFTFQPPTALPEGINRVRVLVLGESVNNAAGMSSSRTTTLRIDRTSPTIVSSSIANNARLPSLTQLTLNVEDQSFPRFGELATPVAFNFPALNPATVQNVGNYRLIHLGDDRELNTPLDQDLSGFIASASFTSTTNRTAPRDPYTGQIQVRFNPGLPGGPYAFVVISSPQGVTDAVGNPIDGNPTTTALEDYVLFFDVEPEPIFLRELRLRSRLPEGGFEISGPRSYFEVAGANGDSGAAPPPDVLFLDFSSPLANRDYTGSVLLVRSANAPGGAPDGDFGVGRLGDGVGHIVVPTTVTVSSSRPNAQFGEFGFQNRLVVRMPRNLPPDYYRIVVPNDLNDGTAIFDVFGNQLDGEFLANPTTDGDFETLLPDGRTRRGLTGDLVEGGSFVTSFIVAANGNVIHARADYEFDPFSPNDIPDGSRARPFPLLQPGTDIFGNNLSAFTAATTRVRGNDGVLGTADDSPVVIVALPSISGRNPLTGAIEQLPFVIRRPGGLDGSASVPYFTTLVLNPGATVKLQNASLFVQNQGSAIQARGGTAADERVIFTSFLDDSVGGDTNRDGTDTRPRGGDWGGIVLRNYNDVSNGRAAQPAQFPVDGKLGLSGADDTLSFFNQTRIHFAGGTIDHPIPGTPNRLVQRYDAITLFNSRPHITNSHISRNGEPNSTQAAISGDLDSFREDMIARGPMIRNMVVRSNTLNGIWVRPEFSGRAQQTNAMFYPNNPNALGGTRNFTFDDPLPYILTSEVVIGQQLNHDTGGFTTTANRLYIQPGMMIKGNRGAGIVVQAPSGTAGTFRRASINIGDRTYINQFDTNSQLSPMSSGFRPNTTGDAKVLLTSLYDDAATTVYRDPNTGQTRTIVPASPALGTGSPIAVRPGSVPYQARWGGVTITGGARAVVDEAEFRYGGGALNTQGGSVPIRPVLSFMGPGSTGTRVSVTNNDFFDNLEAPLGITPNGLLAGDPLRPLLSGTPFFRGNVMQRNTYNGMRVYTRPIQIDSLSPGGIDELVPDNNSVTQTVNALWGSTDLVYILRGSVTLAGHTPFFNPPPLPDANQFADEPQPAITLTIQSSLPDTLLANGQRIPRPGESVVVKTLNLYDPPGDAEAGSTHDANVGAGFIVGVDDGIDPDDDPLIDPGWNSQIRIVGIPANERTGQERVPAVITSLLDDTVGPTVRGVNMSRTYEVRNPAFDPRIVNPDGSIRQNPLPGDGGVIYFGGLSLTDFDMLDPRSGNRIDNADIRYMTRIEMQGGGVADVHNTLPSDPDDFTDAFDLIDAPRLQKRGSSFTTPFPGLFSSPGFLTQRNAAKALTITNSNLASFSQVGVLAHPGFDLIGRDVGPLAGLPPIDGDEGFLGRVFRTSFAGQPNHLLLIGNTITNMPVGIRVISDDGDNDTQQEPAIVLMLHNTFNNNDTVLNTIAPAGVIDPSNSFSHVLWLAMNNIFANSSVEAITVTGQQGRAAVAGGSQGQYNLFWNNASNFSLTDPGIHTFGGAFNGAFEGNPMFRDGDNGDFRLMPGSAAIDASRSELGPTIWGKLLTPIVTQVLDDSGTGGIRRNFARSTTEGTRAFDMVTLPGSVMPLNRIQISQWRPVPWTTPNSFNGTGTAIPGTFNYVRMDGERDQAGFIRQDDPGTNTVGTGSRPFFDVGAHEFRLLQPPRVARVTATITDPNASNGVRTVNLYRPDPQPLGGVNQTPQTIRVTFDRQVDPATLNSMTVLLQGSGGDGIFLSGNSPQDRFYSLAGNLDYDRATRTLIINVGAAGLDLGNDLYRITLVGTGADVIRDPQGLALDGDNRANGRQLPLPSGDGFPGGNFIMDFTIDRTPPRVVANTLRLDPATDTNRLDNITANNRPAFIGQVFDVFPPLNPLQGLTVIVDIDTNGDGTFNRRNAGTATTDANGFFRVQVNQPLPDSRYNVGPDGILGTADDSGHSRARIRVIDLAGNESRLDDRNAITQFIIDTAPPRITNVSPPPNTNVGASPVNGRLNVSITFNENIDLSTITNNSVQVVRSGGDGDFTTGVVNLSIDTASIRAEFLDRTRGGSGRMRVSFDVVGVTANDLYRVTLVGTGPNAVTDIAGNPLAGGDFVLPFVRTDPAAARIIFVGTPGTGTQGARENPFPTITQALAAAHIGDTVAVLPGVYTEQIELKSLVRVISVDQASTVGNLIPGNAQETVIRAPFNTTGRSVTVSARNLRGAPGAIAELRGFTIASPLANDPARGPIRADSIGVEIVNSAVLVHKNYIITSGFGVAVVLAGNNPSIPRIESNGIVGNVTGALIQDAGLGTLPQAVPFVNNTVAFNTTGLFVLGSAGGQRMATAVNNIFWQNRSRTNGEGFAIRATAPNSTAVVYNLFSRNGRNPDNPGDDVSGVATDGFNPSVLASQGRDSLGNLVGDPAFVAPRDPRPEADGPAIFHLDANFDLTSRSAAIDNALAAAAPGTDFRNRGRVTMVPGRRGPADMGAFEFRGTGGIGAGGAFRPVTTSLSESGAFHAAGALREAQSAPNAIIVTFSAPVDPGTVQPTDLVLSGSGLDLFNPARAVGLTWIDSQTIQFNLAGGFNRSGIVRVEIPQAAVRNTRQEGNLHYADYIQLLDTTPPPPPVVPLTPAPAPPPVAAVGPQPGPARRPLPPRFRR